MKKIGFIGAYDKTDLIIYIAKILELAGEKVLIVDATNNQKAKYIVPVLNPSTSYITNYKGIDIAVGLNSFEEINCYLGLPSTAVPDYDFALIDIDKPESMKSFNMIVSDKRFFVTSMDLYSIKRGLEVLSGLSNAVEFTKIYFTSGSPQVEDDYFNFLSLGYKAIWNQEKIYFPFNTNDQAVIIENQRESEITVKNLSSQYKETMMYVVTEIVGHEMKKEIKRVFKLLEKGA
ncbi:MAG: hypothetical protein Q4G05_00990 [Clostridia bacterium]|nr:hypothetical protein [Clostridia bacterium]